MRLVIKDNIVHDIQAEWSGDHYKLGAFTGLYHHEELVEVMTREPGRFKAYMFVVECEFLADEHWQDPLYMHRTNELWTSVAGEEARRNLINKYMSDSKIQEFREKHQLLNWKYNYKEDSAAERKFQLEVEDAIFRYQELREMFEIIEQSLKSVEFKLDEDQYEIVDENGDPVPEADPTVVQKQREALLERILAPRVGTKHERVYAMPEPLNHWDSRSFWHNFFLIEDEVEKDSMWARGNGGSSGAREDNGRWAHVFAVLSKHHGWQIPTMHLKYDAHNILRVTAEYPTFKCFWYDLCGNYPGSYTEVEKLFTEFYIDPAIKR